MWFGLSIFSPCLRWKTGQASFHAMQNSTLRISILTIWKIMFWVRWSCFRCIIGNCQGQCVLIFYMLRKSTRRYEKSEEYTSSRMSSWMLHEHHVWLSQIQATAPKRFQIAQSGTCCELSLPSFVLKKISYVLPLHCSAVSVLCAW